MSANDDIFDRAVAHEVNVQKYTNNIVRRMLSVINRSDDRLTAEVQKVAERLQAGQFTMARLEKLLAELRSINSSIYSQIYSELTDELKKFAEYEATFQVKTLADEVPIAVASVSQEQVYAAAMSRPFQGVLLKGALDDVAEQTAKRIRQTIAQGFVEQRAIDQVVRDIRGTRANKYQDGLLQKSRRDVEAIVRTATAHMAGVAREQIYQANDDLIKGLQWLSTLDSRTSPQCQVRDRKLYTVKEHKPIGHSIPWLGGPGRLHWNCRSTSIPVLKTWRDMGVDIDEFSPTERASLDGAVPAEINYADWIKKQSYSRQVEVLGETRAKLMRDGKLSLGDMYSQKGQFLTLEELRQKEAAAFRKIS